VEKVGNKIKMICFVTIMPKYGNKQLAGHGLHLFVWARKNLILKHNKVATMANL